MMTSNDSPSAMTSSSASKSPPSRPALITGSSSGLGRVPSLSPTYVEQGARIVCADIVPNTPILSKALAETDIQTPTVDGFNNLHPLEPHGGHDDNNSVGAVYMPCDTTPAAENEAAVQQYVDVFARLDIMVCNAGISVPFTSLHQSPACSEMTMGWSHGPR